MDNFKRIALAFLAAAVFTNINDVTAQEIEVEDMSLILAFWKDYMEDHNLLFLSPEEMDFH